MLHRVSKYLVGVIRETFDKQVSSPPHGNFSGNVQGVYSFLFLAVDEG